MKLDGTEILFGGNKLTDHSIPAVYGAYNPTAIKVAIKHFKSNKILWKAKSEKQFSQKLNFQK